MGKATRTAQDQTTNLDAYQYFDGLGRPARAAQSEGGNSFIYAETKYDAMGRASQVSNLYRTGETVRWTTNAYDDLGRAYMVTTPDGAQVSTTSQGVQTRTFLYDSLSRLTSATNPESGTIQYQYDNNGNVLSQTITVPAIGTAQGFTANHWSYVLQITQ